VDRWRCLGEYTARREPGQAVLLLASELVAPYPNMDVYAVKARSSAEAHPIFRGKLPSDALIFLFDLTLAEMRRDDGERAGLSC
jgi:hypothetical protein